MIKGPKGKVISIYTDAISKITPRRLFTVEQLGFNRLLH